MRKKFKVKLFLVPYRYPATQKCKKSLQFVLLHKLHRPFNDKKKLYSKISQATEQSSFHTLTFMDL